MKQYVKVDGKRMLAIDTTELAETLGVKKTSLSVMMSRKGFNQGMMIGRKKFYTKEHIKALRATINFGHPGRRAIA